MERHYKKGFTLIEVAVVTALATLLIASVASLLMLGQRVWQDAEAGVITQQEARRALNELRLDLMRSSWATTAQGGPPQAITVAADGTSIIFQIPSSTTSTGVVTWGDVIQYRVGGTGTQLLREDLTTGQTRIAANAVQNITFGRLASQLSVITVSINSQRTSLSTRVFTNQLQTNVAVRN